VPDIDASAPTFGLPLSLQIPIAARTLEAIRRFVGEIQQEKVGRDGRPRAVLVGPVAPAPGKEPDVPLWSSQWAVEANLRLHPSAQVWVDVDYKGYRRAYASFGLLIPRGYFLDHVQNRRAIKSRGRSFPWLRLCAVSSRVNTSGGAAAGGEGMENEYLSTLEYPETLGAQSQIIYADPMDLTKMLNMEPGTRPLDGVREAQAMFYPK
jgi:hypothetical protein